MVEPHVVHARPRGLVLRGLIWPGAGAPVIPSGIVVVDPSGRISALGPSDSIAVSAGLPSYGDERTWIGPGLVDAHVHLMFGSPDEMARGGVVAVRDLGARLEQALRWRTATPGPLVAIAGPVITAPGGYPTTTWGSDGVGVGVTASDAESVAAEVMQAGVDVLKVALEPAGGLPMPSLEVVRTLVDAAHERGLAVVAHALTAHAVELAIDAGVDELAHMPVEPLPPALQERLAASGIAVVSTLHALTGYPESAVRENAAALIAAGVPVVYGTDLGNEGTRTGAEPRELDLLAAAGLGAEGALRAATDGAAAVSGLRGRPGLGRLAVGEPAALAVLRGDPVADPQRWRDPLIVVIGRHAWSSASDEAARSFGGHLGEPALPDLVSSARADLDDASRHARDDGPSGPDSIADLFARFRPDLGSALIVLAVSLIVGALMGALWETVVSPARMVVVNGAARFADPDEQQWISTDGWFCILGVAAGTVVATLAYLRFRSSSVGMTIGLATGGLGGSYVASWVGRALGPPPIDPGLAAGTEVTGPIVVHATAVLYAWPIAALAVVIALTAGFDRTGAQSSPESRR